MQVQKPFLQVWSWILPARGGGAADGLGISALKQDACCDDFFRTHCSAVALASMGRQSRLWKQKSRMDAMFDGGNQEASQGICWNHIHCMGNLDVRHGLARHTGRPVMKSMQRHLSRMDATHCVSKAPLPVPGGASRF